jgi:hypothetical protein
MGRHKVTDRTDYVFRQRKSNAVGNRTAGSW